VRKKRWEASADRQEELSRAGFDEGFDAALDITGKVGRRAVFLESGFVLVLFVEEEVQRVFDGLMDEELKTARLREARFGLGAEEANALFGGAGLDCHVHD
jgi:hypothetical protein